MPAGSTDFTPGSADGALDRVAPLLSAAHARAAQASQAAGGATMPPTPSRPLVYAADVIVALAAEGELERRRHAGRRSGPRTGARRAGRGRGLRPLPAGGLQPDRCSSCRPSSPPRSSCGCCSISTSRSRPPSGAGPAARRSSASSPSGPTRRHAGSAPRPRRRSPAAAGSRSSAARTSAPRRCDASANRPAQS